MIWFIVGCFVGAVAGFITCGFLYARRLFEMSARADFQRARAEELAAKVQKLEEWASPMLPVFGRFNKKGGRDEVFKT